MNVFVRCPIYFHSAQLGSRVSRHFVNSAYWTFTALDVARLEVRFCSVSARVDKAPEHNLGNLDAFNTDGLSVFMCPEKYL